MKNKLKIYKTFHAYSNYIAAFYAKNPNLFNRSYSQQKQALIDDGFPWIFTWSTYNSDTNVEIFETVHNCEELQKAWNKNKSYGEDWQVSIVIDQIKEFQPDICILYPPTLFTASIIGEIKGLLKDKIIIGGYDGMDRKNLSLYEEYDFIITCSDYISKFYKQNNILTYTLNFGFDQSILSKINANLKHKYAVGFSGSIYQNIHDKRYDLLKELTKNNDVVVRSDFGVNTDYGLFSKNQLKRLIFKKDYQNYLGLWRISKNNTGPVYGLEMYQFLYDSKVSINMHGDKVGFAANVRMFEITGVGSCMLTDWKENIADIFEPNKEILTYNSIDEACDKVSFLLKNEKTRKGIAQAGQKRTLSEYTYEKRMPLLFGFLKNLHKII